MHLLLCRLGWLVLLSVAAVTRGQPDVACYRDFPDVKAVTFDQVFNLISDNGWNATVSRIYCQKLDEAKIPQKFPQFPELSTLSIISAPQLSCFTYCYSVMWGDNLVGSLPANLEAMTKLVWLYSSL